MVKTIYETKAKKAADEQTRKYRPSIPPPLAEDGSYRKGKVKKPSLPPPLKMDGYDIEAAAEAVKALKHQQNLAERLRQIRENKATTSGGASVTRARVAAKGIAKSNVPLPVTLRQRLQNPVEIRRAIIMREVLDPPVALR